MSFQNGWRGPDIVSDGLVLYLDAGSPNSYRPDFGTTWKDMSGNSYSASLNNGASYNSDSNGSILFDGVDDYVLIQSNIDLNFPADFSISLWINPIESGSAHIVANQTTDFTIQFGGNFGGQLIVYDGANRLLGDIPMNTWSNISLTRQGSTLIAYVNTTSILTWTNSSSTRFNINGAYIGNRWTTTFPFKGRISTIIANKGKCLSASEILQNYNAQKSRFGL